MNGYRTLFLVAALYDLVLGAVFFLLYGPAFELLGIALPNNTSYIHLTDAFVIVQGLGYWFVYQAPIANRGIAKVGVSYKFAFAALSIYYFLIGELLHSIFVLFGIADIAFLIGFVLFLRATADRVPAE